MSIETDLYATLSGAAGVTALVSTRIFMQVVPENTALPAIAFFVVSGDRSDTLAGVGDGKRKRIQISCYANTLTQAKAVADAVETALQGNGYLSLEYDIYDPEEQTHTAIIDWSFLD